jgi:hypothetical protein
MTKFCSLSDLDNRNLFLMPPEVGSSKSRCQSGGFLMRELLCVADGHFVVSSDGRGKN